MAGTFTPKQRPARPGAYFRYVAQERPVVLPSTGAIVAVPFVSDWGPLDAVVPLNRWEDYYGIFGDSINDGYRGAKGAFQGEGAYGRGGAGQVLAYRFAGAAAAKATRILSNGAAGGVTLTARYEGTFGNRLSAKISPTKDELVVLLDGTIELESFDIVPSTGITALAADIAANSDYVVPSAVTTGTALTAGTFALTGGNDGAVLTGADWSAVMDAFDNQRFGYFAPSNLTDAAVVASMQAWTVESNLEGKRFTTVFGGLTADTASTARARSALLNDEAFINLGVGNIIDEELGTLNTAQLASRIAGIAAQRGGLRGLTYARLGGVTLMADAIPKDEVVPTFQAGVLFLTRDFDPLAPVKIEKGVTSYTGGDAGKPVDVYSNPKFVRTMMDFEMEMTEWAETNVIGWLAVNEQTRALVVGEALQRLRARRDSGELAAGTVAISVDPPPSDTDDFVALDYSITFARGLEQVLNTVRIA